MAISRNYIAIDIFTEDNSLREILIALLTANGFEGVEENEKKITAFIPEEVFISNNSGKFIEDLSALHSVRYEKRIIPDENWNESWEKNFQPVIIGNEVGVRAAFHKALSVKHEIIIDPKMSFGTGHHATTEMMIRLMLKQDFKNKTVLDFGCGTGILSIFASLLGANKIEAVDHEEWAYNNCLENLSANKIKNVKVILGDENKLRESTVDIILANINRNIILQTLPTLFQRLNKNGMIFFSGFLLADEPDIISVAEELNLKLTDRLESSGWIANCFYKDKL